MKNSFRVKIAKYGKGKLQRLKLHLDIALGTEKACIMG